jgi:hypothetical protein
MNVRRATILWAAILLSVSADWRQVCFGQSGAQKTPATSPGGNSASRPAKDLIADLSSADGPKRIAATKALFDLDGNALEPLKQAGAKQISPLGTIDTSRLDMVYSLLDGLKPNPPGKLAGYTPNGFGLRVEAGCTRDEVAKMGVKYGFEISGQFTADGVPNCYVTLKAGKVLADVLKAVLAGEEKVVSANLNYFDA